MRESAMSGTDEMIRNKRLDAVNRIKYEHYEEFEESLFADVYEKAVVLTSYIVDANLRDECKTTYIALLSFCRHIFSKKEQRKAWQRISPYHAHLKMQ